MPINNLEIERKLREYFLSDEFQSLVDQIDGLLGIDPNNPENYQKDGALFYFLTRWFEEKTEGEEAKNLAKEVLNNFLSEEEINKVIDFVNQNFSAKREEIWQKVKQELHQREKEETETTAQIKEESFEEKEKRYIAMMQEILNLKRKAGQETKPEQLAKEIEIEERLKAFKKFASEDDDQKFLDLSKME